MKTFFAALLLCACAERRRRAGPAPRRSRSRRLATAADEPAEVVTRRAIGGDRARRLRRRSKEPKKFAGKTVIIEGVVERVCQAKGCWMRLPEAAGDGSVRVTFDHRFTVPKEPPR